MTREESIELASRLCVEYADLETISEELKVNEQILKNPAKEPKHKIEYLKYFKPFFIISVFVMLLYFPLYLIAFVNNFALYDRGAEPVEHVNLLILTGLLAVVALIHFFGGKYSRKKDREAEKALADWKSQSEESHKLLESHVVMLRERIDKKKNDLKEYDGIVPESLRSGKEMSEVLAVLEQGNAEDFGEAVKLVQSKCFK